MCLLVYSSSPSIKSLQILKHQATSGLISNQKSSMLQAVNNQNKTAGKKGIKLDSDDSNKTLVQMKSNYRTPKEANDLIVISAKLPQNHSQLHQKKNNNKKTAKQGQGKDQQGNQKDLDNLIQSQHKIISKQQKIPGNDCSCRQIQKENNETDIIIEQISQEDISFGTKISSPENRVKDSRLFLQNDQNSLELSQNQSEQKRSLTNESNQFSIFSQTASQQEVKIIACQQLLKSPDGTLSSPVLVQLSPTELQQNLQKETSSNQNQNQSNPSIQMIEMASDTQEQLKIEPINSTLKNKWRIKQRFLCDKKKTAAPIFQPTASFNTAMLSDLDNKDTSKGLQIQNSNAQIQLLNQNEEIKQLASKTCCLKNNTIDPFLEVIQDKITPAGFRPEIQTIGLIENSQENKESLPSSPIRNFNSLIAFDQESSLKFKSDRTEQIFQLINSNNTKSLVNSEKVEEKNSNSTHFKAQSNALLLKRQDSDKSQMGREPSTSSYPSGGGGDEQETSTNDESNFTSINSACSQTIQHDKQRGLKNIKNQSKAPPQQQRSSSLKRSISVSSLGKSKQAMELSFSADEIHTKDSSLKNWEVRQIVPLKQSQIVSLHAEGEDERKSSSQKCFEQLLQLNLKGHNQFNLRDEKGIAFQLPDLTFSAQQGRQITKDCRARVAVENKVKRIAVRMKFEQDLLEDEDDSENQGYDCSDNEDEDDDNSLDDSSDSDDDDKDDEDSSEDDEQSCSVSSRSTLQIKRGNSSNTDQQGHTHSPTHILLPQQHKLQYPFHLSSDQYQSQQNSQVLDCQGRQVNEEICLLGSWTEKEFYENKAISQNYLSSQAGLPGAVNASQEDEDAAKKKRKKKKSQEQKKKRRNKRKQKLKNKKKDSNKSTQLHYPSNEFGNAHSDLIHKPMREDWQHSNLQLKRLLDENLLEYFTITLSLSAHRTLSIYITDFYQFDEQFDLQSLSYGIDASTILDAKINFIFQIITLQLYPAMTGFFDSLLNSYAFIKQPYLQINDQDSQKSDFELLTLAFIKSFNEFNETKSHESKDIGLKRQGGYLQSNEEDTQSGSFLMEQLDHQQQKQFLNKNEKLLSYDTKYIKSSLGQEEGKSKEDYQPHSS